MDKEGNLYIGIDKEVPEEDAKRAKEWGDEVEKTHKETERKMKEQVEALEAQRHASRRS